MNTKEKMNIMFNEVYASNIRNNINLRALESAISDVKETLLCIDSELGNTLILLDCADSLVSLIRRDNQMLHDFVLQPIMNEKIEEGKHGRTIQQYTYRDEALP